MATLETAPHMFTDDGDKQWYLGQASTVCPMDVNDDTIASSDVFAAIMNAGQGGGSGVSYWQSINQATVMMANAQANGFTEDVDDNGLPVHYIMEDDGHGNSFFLQFSLDIQKQSASAGATADDGDEVVLNGNDVKVGDTVYAGIGVMNMDFGYSNYTWSSTSRTLAFAVGSSVVGKLLWTAIAPKLVPMLKDFVTTTMKSIKDAASRITFKGPQSAEQTSEDVANEAEGAEGDTAATGFEVTTVVEEVGTQTAAMVAADGAAALTNTAVSSGLLAGLTTAGTVFIGVGIVIAVGLIVASFVLHNTYHKLRIWNLTNYTMTWTIHFDTSEPSDEGQLVWGPVDPKTGQNLPLSRLRNIAPPNDKPTPHAFYADFSINSSSEHAGIGYAIQLTLTDDTTKAVAYICTAYFDMPFSGNNSTNVTFNNVGNLQDWYQTSEGNNQSLHGQATSLDGMIHATTSYDYLSGQHPTDAAQIAGSSTDEAFYYRSVLNITQEGLMASSLS